MVIQNLTEEDLSMKYWDYFCALEYDLKIASRYIDFTEDNFSSYSIEFTRLLLSSCAEIDVILKHICKKLTSSSKADNIYKYQKDLIIKLPDLFTESVFIGSNLNPIKPYEGWSSSKAPNWWTIHNKVKYERNEFYYEANLKNVLESISALFIAVHYYYKIVLTNAMTQRRGKSFSWKDLTQVLNSNIQFVRFEADYYNRNLVM
ncbi:hypothetical protein [Nonlabens ponticola]|uniref:Uncharacterized protein n=1 Tax=Nonlabens ponticola TaxID=2496866 RepID=A0A3S9MX32_9FLAO|nr:hypothetical protein [Nonlabens ponticola]AZQ43791.1 hypothetical protein EJ995_05940 [Nonlabens ponticola]